MVVQPARALGGDLERPRVGHREVDVVALRDDVGEGRLDRALAAQKVGHRGLDARLGLAVEVETDRAARVRAPDADDGAGALEVGHDVLLSLPPEEVARVAVGERVSGSLVGAGLGRRVDGAVSERLQIGLLGEEGGDGDRRGDEQRRKHRG